MSRLETLGVSQEELERFCRRHGIRRLALFGSALRDDFGRDSDLDVLVEFESDHPVGLISLARIERELSALIGRQVDLNTPGFLSKYFRDDVLHEAEVQYDAA